MTAPASQPPPSGADPSMEDILASIRRILSEDEAEAAPPPPAHIPEAPSESDVLALDTSMMVEAAPPEPPHQPEPPPPAVAAAPPPPAPPKQVPEPVHVSDQPRPLAEPLLGPAASAAASSSVGSLLRTLVSERQQVAVHRGGPTIEDMVREEVRPLLKDWLDANLPSLVERLVRAEIERLVGQSLT